MRALGRLALPIVIVQVGLMFMGVVDTIMVGHVSAAGLGAVALGNLYFFAAAIFGMGVLLALDGLHPLATGARVSFAGGKPTVTDGPYVETNEVLGGYWMIRVNSKEEAIEWAKRCPAGDNEVIELRQVFEMEDFPADVQEAASGFTEMQASAQGSR